MGSRLFHKYVEPDESFDAISQRVWRGTPWITDAYTGSLSEDRSRSMIEWCWERFGREAWPFSDDPIAGRWKQGGATVFGWTWFGFDTEAAMREFEAAWPSPPLAPAPAEQSPSLNQKGER